MGNLYGVVGHPVKHSLSPAMFEAAFWEYDMDDEYKQFEIAPTELGAFLDGVRGGDADLARIYGLSVTIPHKESLLEHIDALDAHAKTIGAVNTIVKDDGSTRKDGRVRLKGANTDWIGAKRAIEEVMDVEGKDVVVLGAGGAAAAIVYACVQMKARVTILNRTLERAEAMAERFSGEDAPVVKAGLLSDLMSCRAHLLVHTTSVGMGADAERSLVPVEFFKKGMVVFDIVYTPLENRLVREAKRHECRIIPGYKMLLYQGERQFELWFGKKPRTEKMEEALLQRLKST